MSDTKQTEHIDRLFLELSQFTRATTRREAVLQQRLDLVEAESLAMIEAARVAGYRFIRVGKAAAMIPREDETAAAPPAAGCSLCQGIHVDGICQACGRTLRAFNG